MKKPLLFLITVLFIANVSLKAQQSVVFCPPGAEWRYMYTAWIYAYAPKVKYLRDSLMNGETVKVLQYEVFYPYENLGGCGYLMYLKQHGDTIFMKCCQTQNTWQILYNFAATVGQQWQTTVKDTSSYVHNASPVTHTITVNATSTVNINNHTLKTLAVTYCYTEPVTGSISCGSGTITERIGYRGVFVSNFGNSNGGFLFNYYKRIADVVTDYDWWFDFLCYRDNDFSPTSFSIYNRSCDYDVGIRENSADKINLSVYPNPSSNIITVELPQSKIYDLKLSSTLGVLCKEISFAQEKTEIDLSELKTGFYFLQVFEKGKLVATQKVIKE